MRIAKLKAKRFGLLRDFQCDTDAPLVVIQGLNESGKSTTFELLLTLLFGYKNHGTKRSFKLLPKVLPWSGEMPQIEGAFSCDDGQHFDIVRELQKNKPVDYIIKNARNIPVSMDESLPSLGGMSRETFETMYALKLSQMTHLKRNWEDVRERLLGGLYPSYLKSYRSVEKDIQEQMRTIWKDERATKHSKELDSKIAEIKQVIGELRQKQHNMRDMEIDIARHREKILGLEEEVRQLEKDIQQKRKDKQIVGALKVIHHLERRAGDISNYQDVPDHPLEHYQRQWDSIDQASKKIQELKIEADRLAPTIQRFDDDQRKILENKHKVHDLRIKKQNLDNAKKQLEIDRRKIAKISAEIASMADELLVTTAGNWKDMILDLDLASLKSVAETYTYYERLRLERLGIAPKPSAKKPLPWRVMGGLALIIAAVAMVFLSQPMIGAGMGLGGIILWVIAAINRRRQQVDLESRDTEFDTEITSCQETWRGILARLPLPEEWLHRPDSRSYERLKQLKGQIAIEAENIEELLDLEQCCLNTENEIKDQIKNLLGRDTSMDVGIAQLEEALDNAREISAQCQTAKAELKIIKSRIEEEQDRERHAKEAIQELTKKLQPMGEGSTEENIKLLLERRKAASEARSRRRDLEAQYADFTSLEKRALDLMTKDFDFDETQDNEKMNVLEQSLRDARATKTKLETELGMMVKTNQTPADMEAELLALEQERDQRIYKRDQLALALALIKTGRDQFMEYHRPQFLEQAQNYLATITGGKYTRIALDESGEDFVIDLGDTQAKGAKEFSDKLSQGTLEQVYMALRLAMLDQLDPVGERLPLILDEVLVNWDRNRRGNFNGVLREITNKRQVILFTCHGDMSKQLKSDGLSPMIVEI